MFFIRFKISLLLTGCYFEAVRISSCFDDHLKFFASFSPNNHNKQGSF